MQLVNPTLLISFNNFYMTSAVLIRSLRRHPALPHLSSWNSAGRSVCSNRPLPHFLHLVISPELVACSVSTFMLLILGEMVLVGMTVFLSALIRRLRVCEALTLHG